MTITEQLKQKILDGGQISREEALLLTDAPLEELSAAADRSEERRVGKEC